jgi:hypothetical protein
MQQPNHIPEKESKRLPPSPGRQHQNSPADHSTRVSPEQKSGTMTPAQPVQPPASTLSHPEAAPGKGKKKKKCEIL